MEEYEKIATEKKDRKTREPWEIFVSQGSKMRNVIPYCLKMLTSNQRIVLSGTGAQLSKTISIAEIVKRKHKGISQETSLYYTEFEERWEPKDKTKGLDSLSVSRNVPTIQITLSLYEEEKKAVSDVASISREALAQLKKELKSDLREMVYGRNELLSKD